MAIALVTGGARSGKSAFAEGLATTSGTAVTYVATGEALDPEMTRRIAHHRERRPKHWSTVEEPLHLSGALTGIEGTVIIDCLSLWVSNQMMVRRSDDEVLAAADALIAVMALHRGLVVVVTNEVGSGIVPDNEASRRYRDLLGWVNQKVAHAAGDAWLLASGLPVRLKGTAGV
jgi:adenosylcobinamide kinase/adenosylcobinamide-phosphate guanylyltransferase